MPKVKQYMIEKEQTLGSLEEEFHKFDKSFGQLCKINLGMHKQSCKK
jgi:hypothetical protein